MKDAQLAAFFVFLTQKERLKIDLSNFFLTNTFYPQNFSIIRWEV